MSFKPPNSIPYTRSRFARTICWWNRNSTWIYSRQEPGSSFAGPCRNPGRCHPSDHHSHTAFPQKEVIATLSVTILIESIVVTGYAFFNQKQIIHLLFSCLLANLLTQPLLWLVLQVFFRHYLLALFFAEFWIWIVESAILFLYPHNQLRSKEALGLSLAMNLASFATGWFLPL